MDGKAERRWLGTSPCDNERTIALRANAIRAYEGKASELIPPGPRSRVGTRLIDSRYYRHGHLIILYLLVFFLLPKRAIVEAAECDVNFHI